MSSKLQAIAGNNENYDTDETTIVAGQKVTFTTLTVQGKDRTYRVAWFLDDKGQRVYFPYRDTNGLHDTSDLQGIHWGHDYTVEHESDGGMSTYFRSTDGAYYKITDYSNSETKISKYERIIDIKFGNITKHNICNNVPVIKSSNLLFLSIVGILHPLTKLRHIQIAYQIHKLYYSLKAKRNI